MKALTEEKVIKHLYSLMTYVGPSALSQLEKWLSGYYSAELSLLFSYFFLSFSMRQLPKLS